MALMAGCWASSWGDEGRHTDSMFLVSIQLHAVMSRYFVNEIATPDMHQTGHFAGVVLDREQE